MKKINFKKGDILKIVSNESEHYRDIGSEVIVIDIIDSNTLKCEDSYGFYLYPCLSDVEKCENSLYF